MDTQTDAQNAPAESEEAVINWLRQNVIPVQHIEAGNGFADLQPLKTLLNDVKVVGLGEATHGTREFFQFKHRLLEFLVTEMNFTAFAIEASYAACQPINDYVLYGKGDLASALTGQGYVPWDCEEVTEMVRWMRAHNLRMPDEKKVKFWGIDLWRNDLGRQAVMDYLRRIASDRLTATQSLFEALASEEAKWPTHIDAPTEITLGQLLPQIEDLNNYLTANKDAFINRSSSADFERIMQYIRIMRQWIIANTPDSMHPSQPTYSARSTYMAENLVFLIDHGRLGEKVVAWAHNGHVSLGNWGQVLRTQYGNGYYSFGFEFNQGSFYTRTFLPNMDLGDLKEVTLPPAITGSLAWYLIQTGIGNLILNLRAPSGNPVIHQWLRTPRRVRNVVWGYSEDSTYSDEVDLSKKYDGLIFIERTTATQPTANALVTVANRMWL